MREDGVGEMARDRDAVNLSVEAYSDTGGSGVTTRGRGGGAAARGGGGAAIRGAGAFGVLFTRGLFGYLAIGPAGTVDDIAF